jgi:hypothetical protein
MALDLLKTPYELLLEQAGYPRMQAGGQPPAPPMARAAQSDGLGVGGVDMTPPNPIDVYRADPTGRFGGKDRMETRPTRLDKTTIEEYIKAMRSGESLGVPQLTPEQLAQMILVEGRSDFGFNALNSNNKRAVQKAKMLQDMGHDPMSSNFAAAIYDKQQLADRIKKPFQEVWNGTGRSAATGRTGAQHNARINEFGYAVENPKNADLMNAIRQAYHYKLQKESENAMPATDQMGNTMGYGSALGYNDGGAVKPKTFHDISKLLIQKHLGK